MERSPCLSCPDRHKDKNRPECVNCYDRLVYAGFAPAKKITDRVSPAISAAVETVEQPSPAITETPMDETKICADAKCQHSGVAQPIENFRIHGPSKNGSRMRICKDCMGRRMAEGQKRRHEKIANRLCPKTNSDQQIFIEKAAVASPGIDDAMEIVFEQYPDTLRELREWARSELRTPADQLVYVVRSLVN